MHISPVIFCIIRRLEQTYKNLRRHAYVQAEPHFTFPPPKIRGQGVAPIAGRGQRPCRHRSGETPLTK